MAIWQLPVFFKWSLAHSVVEVSWDCIWAVYGPLSGFIPPHTCSVNGCFLISYCTGTVTRLSKHNLISNWRRREKTKMAKSKGGTKRIISNFAAASTMHGIGSLNSARSFKDKVFWSIVCLASMGMFCFMLSRIVMRYLEFSVVVNVQEVSATTWGPIHSLVTQVLPNL